MSITLIGLAAVLLFTVLGYRRGVLRIAAFLGSLLAAGVLAEPLAWIVRPLAEGRYYALLDNAKIAAALQDKALVAELQQVVTGLDSL